MLVVATERDQKFVDEHLRVAAASPFANVNALCVNWNERHDFIGNQTVVNNNLGR